MADYINKIRTTDGDKPVNYEALANKPNSLPNPNKIKFTGSVVAEYDGSSEVTVDIPNGASEEQVAQIQTNTNDISELKNKTSELKGEIADKATLENGVVKFWKTSTEENRTDTLLYSVDISSIGGTGGLDLENLTLSVSQVGNYQRLSMSDGTTTKNVDIPIITITDEQVRTAVTEYLDANPVQTGATQEQVAQIQTNTNDISELKNKTSELKGDLDNLNDCIFNGKSPSVDTTSSTEDGVFYSCITGSKETFPSLYTGYAKVESGKYYIIQVYVIGTLDRNLFSFWNNGNLINMGAYENYEVIDETNRIIKVKAPQNATEIRYTNYISDKATGFCKSEFDKVNIEWLSISKDNLDDDLTKPLYPDSLRKPFDFNGKSAAVFGDSISKGVSSPDLVIVDSYIKRFADFVGLSLDNKSISGNWLTNDGSDKTQYPIITSYTTQKDYLFVALGTNDFNSDKELGIFGSTDSSNFYGALHGICEHFKTNHSNSTIIFITPIPYTEAYWDRNQTKAGNHLGYTLNDYRNAIYEVATSYEYNVVDGSTLGMPTGKGGWNNLMCDDTDGCHPTVEGHKLCARNLATKLC